MKNAVEVHVPEMRLPGGPICGTDRVAAVAAIFGLGLEAAQRRLFAPLTFTLGHGAVVLITGPSGAGKSTLLRGIEAALRQRAPLGVIRLEQIPLPSHVPVVDCFSCGLEAALEHLARAGLSEAHVLLRAPAELSEGQRFRYRLAQFFASANDVLLADEFAAPLDRITARVLAYQLQKFIHANGSAKSAILATAHEDLAGDLAADVRIYKGLSDALQMTVGRVPVSGCVQ